MRAYLASEAKYFQKSLRTKDKASAIDKATYEHARLLVLKAEGKAVFSPTVYKAVEMYIKHRYDTDVLMRQRTEKPLKAPVLKALKRYLVFQRMSLNVVLVVGRDAGLVPTIRN